MHLFMKDALQSADLFCANADEKPIGVVPTSNDNATIAVQIRRVKNARSMPERAQTMKLKLILYSSNADSVRLQC
jgi:hypothetical protein